MNEKPIIICQFWFKILKLARRNNIWVLVRLAGRYISDFAKYTEPMTIFGGSRLGSRSGSVATATTTRSFDAGSTTSSRSRKTIKVEPEQTRDQKLMLEMICQVSDSKIGLDKFTGSLLVSTGLRVFDCCTCLEQVLFEYL